MNILHVSASYKPAYIYGGPIISVSELCEMLTAKGEDVQVFTTTANGAGELQILVNKPVNVDGVSVTYFRRLTGDPTHLSPALLLRLWNSAKYYDIIHIHAWWNTVSVLACLIAILKKRKVVLSPRGMLSNYSHKNRRNIFKRMINSLLGNNLLERSYFHATSENEKDDIYKLTGSENIAVIPNLVKLPDEHFNKRESSPSGIFKLLFLSRIEEKKGLDLLLKAISGIAIPYTLSIAGSGDESYIAELKELAMSLEVDRNIDWIGVQEQNSKFQCMASHDLLILPSHNENFANVVLESLSVGTAVLISPDVGLSDYIIESELGWVCKAYPAKLRKTIERAYYNSEKRNFIRMNSPDQVRIDFDENLILNQYLELYKKIIA
jgi:glycosyltransferase involved in cell wall biosynthesis